MIAAQKLQKMERLNRGRKLFNAAIGFKKLEDPLERRTRKLAESGLDDAVDSVDGGGALVSNEPEIFFHYFAEILVKRTAANEAKAKDVLKCLLFSYCRQMWAQREILNDRRATTQYKYQWQFK